MCLNYYCYSQIQQITVHAATRWKISPRILNHNFFSCIHFKPEQHQTMPYQFTYYQYGNGEAPSETLIFPFYQSCLIIYMKNFLHSDWLRAVQFFLKQCRKELIQCKKRKQTKHSDWSMIKETQRWPIKYYAFKSSARPGWRN